MFGLLKALDPQSFVPVRLLQRLSEGPEASRECHFEGAALFADISGYVQLTEEFCSQGEQGLSRLSALLDHSFARYVQLVAQYGGEVAYFAGDGLAAYWPAQGSLEEPAARAVACGLALCQIEDARDEQRINPDLHVGIAAGALWGAKLRSVEEHSDLLLGGTAMRRAARAGYYGARGEVVVSAEVGDLLARRMNTRAKRDGHLLVQDLRGVTARVTPVAATNARIDTSAYAPWSAHGSQGDSLPWSAEIREVHALFARIDGLSETQPDALSAFQAAARTIHETLRPFASSAGQLLIDDKGLVFHIEFGAPLNTHADDASRAAHAALALQDRLSAIGLSCSVGMAAGRAFCGVLGNDTRRAYAVVGQPMNLAARLMSSTDSGVRTTRSIAPHPSDQIDRISDEPLQAKGVSLPLPTYRLRHSLHPRPRTKICGRREEQALLYACLEELGPSTSGVIAVVGEAGFGKSTLLRELQERAIARAVTTTLGGASASPSAVYSAWRNTFETLFGLTTRMSQSETRERVLNVLSRAPELLSLAPLLNPVLPIDLPDNSVTRHLSGQERADAALRLFVDSLNRLADKPLLVILEDAHWMDSSSWRLVEQIARQVHGVLLVIALRPMPPGTGPEALPDEYITVIELSPLTREDIDDVMCETLGTKSVPPALTESVYQLTQGNPLFAHEYTLLLRERGLVREQDNQYVQVEDPHAGLRSMAAPLTVQATITSRLDHLSPIERLTLKTASVAGQLFDGDLLTEVYPIREQSSEVAAALDRLCEHDLLERVSSDLAGSYRFRHSLIRDVAYNVMLHEQRVALHQSVAHALLARSTSGGRLDHALLTHHFQAAGDRAQTLHHGDLAAKSALGAGAYREAVRLLDTCLALSTSPEAPVLDLIRWRGLLADAYAGLGDNTARDTQARSTLLLARQSFRSARTEMAVRSMATFTLRKSIGIPPAPPTDEGGIALQLELAKAHRHRSEVCYFTNDALGLATSQLRAIAHAQRCGPSAELAMCYAQFAGSLAIAGIHPLAERLLSRAIEVAETVDAPLALARALMVKGLYAVGMTRWERAAESIAACQALCDRQYDPVTWGNAQMIAFWSSHYRADVEASGLLASALLDRAEKLGHLQHTIWALRALALYKLASGAPLDALAPIERAVSLMSQTDHENELISAWGICAVTRYRTGDHDGAAAAADRALLESASARRPTAQSTLTGWSSLAEVTYGLSITAPQLEKWSRLFAKALHALARHQRAFPVGESTYRYWHGVSLASAGNTKAATKTWRQGLTVANRLGAICDLKRLQAKLAQPSDQLDAPRITV